MEKRITFKDIINSEIPVILVFFSTNDKENIEKKVFQLSTELKGEAEVLRMDADLNKKIREALRVKTTPTTIIYSEGLMKYRDSKFEESLLKKLIKRYSN